MIYIVRFLKDIKNILDFFEVCKGNNISLFLSLLCPNKLFDWEFIFLEVSNDLVVKNFWHNGLSIEDPEVFVVGAADD